ncbi:MAG: MBL fold metallo-hydrolase [Chloroflexi bacterium]|nr:MBL fold metallo-hydrolase [Chloroflexota bacterium]
MTEEILPNLYRIEVPLPRNPLQAINSYVIKDGNRSLVIDTGMNREECLSVLSSGLKELGVDLKKTDFFITHVHSDHMGLVPSLATDTSIVYFNRPEASSSNKPGSSWQRNDEFAAKHGFPEDERKKAIENHPGRKYSPQGHIDFHILQEGDTIRIGDYLFSCIETPGHTRGHMCLYESRKKLLVSGDHILIDITPNISLTSDDENPLNDYLNSLDKVYDFDIKLVLPGHRRLFKNHRERITELKQHHQERADEVLSILEAGKKNAFQVASLMTWDMTYKSWEQFPPQQKWFAFGEAEAHLKYLEGKGEVERLTGEQEVIFSLKN